MYAINRIIKYYFPINQNTLKNSSLRKIQSLLIIIKPSDLQRHFCKWKPIFIFRLFFSYTLFLTQTQTHTVKHYKLIKNKHTSGLLRVTNTQCHTGRRYRNQVRNTLHSLIMDLKSSVGDEVFATMVA